MFISRFNPWRRDWQYTPPPRKVESISKAVNVNVDYNKENETHSMPYGKQKGDKYEKNA